MVAVLGCFILLMPSFQLGSSGGLWAVVAAVFASIAHISLRALKNEDSWGVVLWFQQGTAVLAIVTLLSLEGEISIPSTELWLPLMGVAVLGTLGQFFMTLAYAQAKVLVLQQHLSQTIVGCRADLLFFEWFHHGIFGLEGRCCFCGDG